MTNLTIENIADWLRQRGSGLYGGEAVTQLEHALQCASLAQENGASDALIAAALLHDICHLAEHADDCKHAHEEEGARLLADLLPPSVTEPVRLHVAAKRYLCAVDPLYWSGLSEQSKRSLEWQGGPFSVRESVDFISLAHADDAIRLREWDDAAKIPGASTPGLDHFLPVVWSLARQTEQA